MSETSCNGENMILTLQAFFNKIEEKNKIEFKI